MIDDNFDIVFRRQGFSNFTYQSETRSDPQVLSQRWVHLPNGAEYLADEFYRRFGDNSFRKLLGRIYKAPAGVSRQYLAKFCSDPTLEQHLTFMRNQELIIEVDSMVSKAPRCQHIADIGRTFEWYVARWFQAFLHCPARYNVHVPGILEGGDLDVVAFLDGLRIWIECKSGRDITDTQLDLFVRRAQEFNPVLAILLIDTDENSVMDNYIARLNKPHTQEDLQFHLKNPREWLFFRGRGLYVVGVPNSIQESLLAVLRFYHDRVRFVPFFWRHLSKHTCTNTGSQVDDQSIGDPCVQSNCYALNPIERYLLPRRGRSPGTCPLVPLPLGLPGHQSVG